MQTNNGIDKANIIERVASAVLLNDTKAASCILEAEYPFMQRELHKRRYTDEQKMQVFLRDKFTDRYSGQHLVNPGLLRAISTLLPAPFPFHSNWKSTECHLAYWELVPTVDHICPIALGGKDEPENWATTNMLNNSIKSNWTLEQLRWSLYPVEKDDPWNGLSAEFVALVNANPRLQENNYILRWYRVSKNILHL